MASPTIPVPSITTAPTRSVCGGVIMEWGLLKLGAQPGSEGDVITGCFLMIFIELIQGLTLISGSCCFC